MHALHASSNKKNDVMLSFVPGQTELGIELDFASEKGHLGHPQYYKKLSKLSRSKWDPC